jgi:hypothetical protein
MTLLRRIARICRLLPNSHVLMSGSMADYSAREICRKGIEGLVEVCRPDAGMFDIGWPQSESTTDNVALQVSRSTRTSKGKEGHLSGPETGFRLQEFTRQSTHGCTSLHITSRPSI